MIKVLHRDRRRQRLLCVLAALFFAWSAGCLPAADQSSAGYLAAARQSSEKTSATGTSPKASATATTPQTQAGRVQYKGGNSSTIAPPETPPPTDPTLEVTVKWLPKPVPNKGAEAKTEATMKPYTEKLVNTDVSFEMAPVPGGAFKMGSPAGEKDRKPDEGPQVESQDRAILDGPPRSHVGRIRPLGPGTRPAAARNDEGRGHQLGQVGRRPGHSHQALCRHDLRHGQARLSGHLHDPVCGEDVLQVAFGQDGPLLPAADRGGVGICLPGRRQDGLLLRQRSGQARANTPGSRTTATRSTTRSG